MDYLQAAIFLNGDRSNFDFVDTYTTKHTLLVGCDGGTDQMIAQGYRPDVIVGDLDSIAEATVSDNNLTSVTYLRYPSDKDFTDSELAIDYVVNRGIKEIYIFGLLGTRVDHLLGNLFLISKHKYANVNIKLIEGTQEIYIIRNTAIIHGKKGDTISFMPLKGSVKAKASSGLKYDLSNYEISRQGNHGISNVLTANSANIELGKSELLVIHQKHAS